MFLGINSRVGGHFLQLRETFGLEGQTKDGRFESSMSRNFHGVLSMMKEIL